MITTSNAQEWLDRQLYPFDSHYIQLETGKMHYVDEGQGEVLLFVHGTPTWSFLYRGFIRELSKNYRCIAIDHLGFGLSEKPEQFSFTPEDHSRNLSEFILKMDLKNITLVVHDFGGPIGLSAGIKHAERINKVVMMNTWLWETKNDKDALKVDKIINSWLGRTLYLNFNFSPKVLLKKGFADKKNLSKNVHKHYISPFPNKSSRYPLLAIGEALVGSSDWYEAQWQQLEALANKEWMIIWGMEDQFITPRYLEKWKQRLPKAQVREMKCGHFVQEEKTEEAFAVVRAFLQK